MLFNSISFLLFFIIVTTFYFVLPLRAGRYMLLLASCYFYMVFVPKYIIILAITITVDYFVGVGLEKISVKYKKTLLIVSIISNIGFLFVFKYFNFFNTNISYIAELINWNYPIGSLEIILPIGLSFHTFQSLSYIIEVYRNKQKAEQNFGIFALYVMFYPQLVAGPIERPQNMLHQFHKKYKFDLYRVADGLKLMLWGMFKKVVIADRLAIFVNEVYNNPNNYHGLPVLIATVFFAFQIYCDFSGYSDIARGSAKVMGFELMVNFDKPYLSKSISEFWKRWHISLSSWFKDYVYIPLGGNRVNKMKLYRNLFITFLLSGLWHGANWTYVIWGGLNGLYLIFSQVTISSRKRIVEFFKINRLPKAHNIFKVACTFVLTTFAWIFFRANSFSDAVQIFISLFSGWNRGELSSSVSRVLSHTPELSKVSFLVAFVLISFLMLIEIIQTKVIINKKLDEKLSYGSWTIYILGIFAIIILGQFTKLQFIYFQF